jgi:hypothetical protein
VIAPISCIHKLTDAALYVTFLESTFIDGKRHFADHVVTVVARKMAGTTALRRSRRLPIGKRRAIVGGGSLNAFGAMMRAGRASPSLLALVQIAPAVKSRSNRTLIRRAISFDGSPFSNSAVRKMAVGPACA